MKILAIDGGLLTGVVWDSPIDGEKIGHDEIGFPEIYDFVEEKIMLGYIDTVVCENFIISARTLKVSRGENWTLKIIGAVEHMCLKWDIDLFLYTPAQLKTFITDEKLKQYNLWLKGEGHSRDACRAYLYHKFKIDPQGTLNELL